MLVILVTTSIIAGVIIDTFAENRAADKAIRDDITNHCFICSLDRDLLEHHGEGFEKHIARYELSVRSVTWHSAPDLTVVLHLPNRSQITQHLACTLLGWSLTRPRKQTQLWCGLYHRF